MTKFLSTLKQVLERSNYHINRQKHQDVMEMYISHFRSIIIEERINNWYPAPTHKPAFNICMYSDHYIWHILPVFNISLFYFHFNSDRDT